MKKDDILSRDIKNFNEFKSYVSTHGFSLSNFYDVQFLIGNNGSSFLKSIFTRGLGTNSGGSNQVSQLMRLYAEECTIPGYSISTGDFRITNTPNMKYAYGIVNNEITISFIADADSEIRQTFDAWGNYIYAGISSNTDTTNILNINSRDLMGRTRYKDEYTLDIAVIKLERFASSKQNSATSIIDRVTGKQTPYKTVPHSLLFPGVNPASEKMATSLFGEARQRYSVRLKNAFPTTISAIPLSSGSSQLVKIQVTFEYDMAAPASQTGGTIEASSNWRTVVN
jgi:hypothetical protein